MRSIPQPSFGRFHLPEEHRRLLRPLAISLLVHAILVWPTPEQALSPASPSQPRHLRANLKEPTQTHAPATLESSPGKLTQATENTPLRAPEERSYATPEAEPAPPAEPDNPPAEAQAGTGNPNTPPVEPAAGVDVAGLREYHIALGRMARQFRRYPPAAREAGWQGRVVLRLAVAAGGTPLGLTLLGSSNYPVLDQAALDMMRLTASHTQVPESLRNRAFTIDLAVDFDLNDAP
jgi:protein TonB